MFNYKPNGYSSSFRGAPRRFSKPKRYRGFNQGKKFSRTFSDLKVFVKKASDETYQNEYTPKNSFNDFNIAPVLKSNINYHGYTTPTPIQDQAIQPILDGKDFIGLANTGTGKTAAFLIPIIDKIYKNRGQKAIIIVPTRELALQITDEFRNLSAGMKLYTTIVIGGANIRRQVHEIRRNPHVVIGTPGRLKDLIQQKVLYLDDFSIFVLDEVDLMVDIGFIHEVKFFISLLPESRQSLFFSATIPSKIRTVLENFVKDPVTISVKRQDSAENIDQNIVKVINKDKKIDMLHDLLIKDGFDKVLVFGRTKHGIEKLNKELNRRGFKAGAIHGNKKQGHRKKTLESFKNNEIQVLLATDLASRGLDIENVTHVINYELPETYENYIHRIGRTGRANKKGVALTFVD